MTVRLSTLVLAALATGCSLGGGERAHATPAALAAQHRSCPAAVMQGWMQSPGHRVNILRPVFKRIGVGCVIDERGHRWWTQDFAG